MRTGRTHEGQADGPPLAPCTAGRRSAHSASRARPCAPSTQRKRPCSRGPTAPPQRHRDCDRRAARRHEAQTSSGVDQTPPRRPHRRRQGTAARVTAARSAVRAVQARAPSAAAAPCPTPHAAPQRVSPKYVQMTPSRARVPSARRAAVAASARGPLQRYPNGPAPPPHARATPASRRAAPPPLLMRWMAARPRLRVRGRAVAAAPTATPTSHSISRPAGGRAARRRRRRRSARALAPAHVCR
jgi:hypothetical protein